MRRALRELIRWEIVGLMGILFVFLLPFDTEHFVVHKVPEALVPATQMENLVEAEEKLFGEIMVHLKNGNQRRAYDSAGNYLKLYPMGKHYYEVYKVFKSNRQPAARN